MSRTLACARRALACACVLALSSCAGNDDDHLAPQVHGLTESNCARRIAEAYCYAAELCCTQAGIAANASCVQTKERDIISRMPPVAGDAIFDPYMASACVNQLRAARGQCLGPAHADALLDDPAGPCARVYHPAPSIPLGERCTDSFECVRPLGVDETSCEGGICSGTRLVDVTGACGTSPNGTVDRCKPGLACHLGHCVQLPQQDQPCLRVCTSAQQSSCDLRCDRGLACDPATMTCLREPVPCKASDECAEGDACIMGRCGPRPLETGGRCHGADQCISRRCVDGRCAPLNATDSVLVNSVTCGPAEA